MPAMLASPFESVQLNHGMFASPFESVQLNHGKLGTRTQKLMCWRSFQQKMFVPGSQKKEQAKQDLLSIGGPLSCGFHQQFKVYELGEAPFEEVEEEVIVHGERACVAVDCLPRGTKASPSLLTTSQ